MEPKNIMSKATWTIIICRNNSTYEKHIGTLVYAGDLKKIQLPGA